MLGRASLHGDCDFFSPGNGLLVLDFGGMIRPSVLGSRHFPAKLIENCHWFPGAG